MRLLNVYECLSPDWKIAISGKIIIIHFSSQLEQRNHSPNLRDLVVVIEILIDTSRHENQIISTCDLVILQHHSSVVRTKAVTF